MSDYHVPVLLEETIKWLGIRPGSKYIDCTLGGGGHTGGILMAGGRVLAIDRDQEAISHAQHKFATQLRDGQLTLYQGNFARLETIAQRTGFVPAQGILFDLGVSSHQLETAERGFSFNEDARLDMRMDQGEEIPTAADLVNGLSQQELTKLFRLYGEERAAGLIARKIVQTREREPIVSVQALSGLILRLRGRGGVDRTHPATRVFQALRIAVNDEINSLRLALPQAGRILAPGGRLVCLSFHSLEDGLVKKQFKTDGVLRELTEKPLAPSKEEVAINPRSRAGKLRVAEKMNA